MRLEILAVLAMALLLIAPYALAEEERLGGDSPNSGSGTGSEAERSENTPPQKIASDRDKLAAAANRLGTQTGAEARDKARTQLGITDARQEAKDRAQEKNDELKELVSAQADERRVEIREEMKDGAIERREETRERLKDN